MASSNEGFSDERMDIALRPKLSILIVQTNGKRYYIYVIYLHVVIEFMNKIQFYADTASISFLYPIRVDS